MHRTRQEGETLKSEITTFRSSNSMRLVIWTLFSIFVFASCSAERKNLGIQVSPKKTKQDQQAKLRQKHLNDTFEELSHKWKLHCDGILSSSIEDYTNCDQFRDLVKLGQPAVPLIIERIRERELLYWEFVLQEITGVKVIKDPQKFDLEEARQHWLKWWDELQTKHPVPAEIWDDPRDPEPTNCLPSPQT